MNELEWIGRKAAAIYLQGTMKQTLIALMGFIHLFLPLMASADQLGDFTYEVNGEGITITDYTGAGGDVTIPEAIADLPVTHIASMSFFNAIGLTSVMIPASVIEIGGSAFDQCMNLTGIFVDAANTVYSSLGGVVFNNDGSELICCPEGMQGAYAIPHGVDRIGDYAFSDCGRLTSIEIPDCVTRVGEQAFLSCSGLTSVIVGKGVAVLDGRAFDYCGALMSIDVDADNGVYSSWNGMLFNKDGITLIRCPAGIGGVCMIPEGVTRIENGAFESCISLDSVYIPGSVAEIGDWAFFDCNTLTVVVISNGVTRIGEKAFGYCMNLSSITIPASVTNIATAPFWGCGFLQEISVDEANTVYSSRDGILFDEDQTEIIQCPAGWCGDYTIPDGVTRIADYAFRDCIDLTDIAIPESVVHIGVEAFFACFSLSRIAIPDSVTSIGEWAFAHAYGLTHIEIGRGVTSIGDRAFSDGMSLEQVWFNGDAPALGEDVLLNSDAVIVYYRPGTTGWGATVNGRTAFCWNPKMEHLNANAFRLAFTVTGSADMVVVVEACTSLVQPDWGVVGTYTLTEGAAAVEDAEGPGHAVRFYRVRAP